MIFTPQAAGLGGLGFGEAMPPELAARKAGEAPPQAPMLKPDPTGDELGILWDSRIDDAQAKWNADRTMREKYVKLYAEGRFPDADEGASVNLCFSYVSFITALIFDQLPEVMVDPKRGVGDEALADALEKFQKYSLEEQEAHEPYQVCVFRSILMGIAWTKESWGAEEGFAVVDALSPLEVHVDPLALYSLKQARFIIQKAVKPIDEAREFFNTNRIEPNWKLSEAKGLEDRAKDQKIAADKDLLQFHEIWCKHAGGKRALYYRLHDRREWLGQQQAWPFILDANDFPFSRLVFNSTFNGIDGFSEQKIVEGLQLEVNELAEFDRRHTRRMAPTKILIDDGVFPSDEDLEDRLLGEKDSNVIRCKAGNRPLKDSYHLMDMSASSNVQEAKYLRAKGLHDEILAFTEQERGVQGREKTATEAEIVDENSKTRISKRQAQVDRWQTKSVRHLVQINRLLASPETVAAAVSPEAAQIWLQFAGDARDLVREYSIGVRAGSTSRRAQHQQLQEAQENLALFQAVNTSLMQMGGPPMFSIPEAAMEVLKARKTRNPERFLIPPEPQAPAPPMAPEGMLPGMGGAMLPMG